MFAIQHADLDWPDTIDRTISWHGTLPEAVEAMHTHLNTFGTQVTAHPEHSAGLELSLVIVNEAGQLITRGLLVTA